MNTPTHALINFTVAKSLGVESFPATAVLIGSLAPDIPLYGLSIGGAAWFRWVEGREWPDIGRHMYGNLFYNDPIWIALHNLLHSPVVLITVLLTLFMMLSQADFLASWWTWFFGSCLLHTLVDIPVHHDDGPLVFWPLNSSYRFNSPFSYWDTAHHGMAVMTFEAGLFVVLVGWWAYRWLVTRG